MVIIITSLTSMMSYMVIIITSLTLYDVLSGYYYY